jgi:hypothetical protein
MDSLEYSMVTLPHDNFTYIRLKVTEVFFK